METQYHFPQIEGSSKNKQKEHKSNLIKFWLKQVPTKNTEALTCSFLIIEGVL